MLETLDLVDQIGDRVEVDARTDTKRTRGDSERGGSLCVLGLEAQPQCVVDHRLEGATRRSRSPDKAGCDIVIKRQRRSG
jgi:hypothetical protein